MGETAIILLLVLINLSLAALYGVQYLSLRKAQKFLNGFVENSEEIVGAVEKCIGIINKNAELLLETAEKTSSLEDQVARVKVTNDIINNYFLALDTINEAHRIQMPLSKRVYQLQHKEEE